MDDVYGPATSWRRGAVASAELSAPVHLQTERLLLRELRMEDLNSTLAYLQDPVVLQHLSWTLPWTREQAQQELWEARHQRHEARRLRYDLGIVLREAGQLIGECGLCLLSPHATSQPTEVGTISYLLRRDQWGRGYATEAARALLTLAFADLGLPSVFGGCHPDNIGSSLVMERVGMIFQGTDASFPGSPDGVQSLVFRLDREQWLDQSAPSFDLMLESAAERG